MSTQAIFNRDESQDDRRGWNRSVDRVNELLAKAVHRRSIYERSQNTTGSKKPLKISSDDVVDIGNHLEALYDFATYPELGLEDFWTLSDAHDIAFDAIWKAGLLGTEGWITALIDVDLHQRRRDRIFLYIDLVLDVIETVRRIEDEKRLRQRNSWKSWLFCRWLDSCIDR